jgi:hypothetical protein
VVECKTHHDPWLPQTGSVAVNHMFSVMELAQSGASALVMVMEYVYPFAFMKLYYNVHVGANK